MGGPKIKSGLYEVRRQPSIRCQQLFIGLYLTVSKHKSVQNGLNCHTKRQNFSENYAFFAHCSTVSIHCETNLVPRVFCLFGQRGTRYPLTKKKEKKKEDSGLAEIGVKLKPR